MDFILRTAIERAIAEVKKELNIDISFDTAKELIRSQSKGIRYAMENKFLARIDHLGSFQIKPGREEAIEASKIAKELGLKGEDRRNFFREFKKANEAKKEISILNRLA